MKLLIRKISKKFHIFYFLLYNDSGGVDMENQIKILNLLNQKRLVQNIEIDMKLEF